MHRERLERLAELLEHPDRWPADHGDRPVRFDLDTWVREEPCGTVCCAAGLAALDPALQAQGLYLADRTVWFAETPTTLHYNWEAVQRFFGLDGPDDYGCIHTSESRFIQPTAAGWVFYDGAYPPHARRDPRAVAARIRWLLAGNTPDNWVEPPAPAETKPCDATA